MSDNYREVTHVETRETIKTSATQMESNEERLDKLEQTVKNLSVINEALYEILVNKLHITAADLAVMMDQVNVSRINRFEAKSTCSSCGMVGPSIKQKCMYCGGELSGAIQASPFDQ